MSTGPLPVIPGLDCVEQTSRSAHTVMLSAERSGKRIRVRLWQPDEDEDPTKLQRFQLDAFALARCSTRGIPRVLSVSKAANVPFVAFEQTDGQALTQVLSERRLSEAETCRLGAAVAETLAALHAAGIVHGNVRSDNILVDEQLENVRLINFAGIDGPEPHSANPNDTVGYDEPTAGMDEAHELTALGQVLRQCLGAPPSGSLALILKRLASADHPRRYASAAALARDLHQIRTHGSLDASGAEITLSTGEQAQLAVASLALAGREKELERLYAVQAAARSEGGKVALVEGASGVGKSRLAQALLEGTLETDEPVLWAKCEQWDPRPFSAIQRLLDSYVARAYGQSDARYAECGALLHEVADDLAPLLKVLPGKIGELFQDAREVPRTDDAEHIYVEGLGEFLARLCRRLGHCALIVDDIQWLDAGSRAVLRRFLGRIGDTDAYLLLLTRPGYDDVDGVSEFRRMLASIMADELVLQPLGQAGRKTLIREYLGSGTLDPEDASALAALNDGTPLASLELLRVLLEANALTLDWQHWRLDRDVLRTLSLPRAALDVLGRRVKTLDEATRDLLALAAVIGSAFEVDFLSEAYGTPSSVLQSSLDRAQRAGLVASHGNSLAFVHDSIQEALLATLSPERLRNHHQVIAEALERRGRSQSEPAHELYALADHYAAGNADANILKVYESSLAAGRRAFETFDNERALHYLNRAQDLADQQRLPPDADLLQLLGEARLRKGELKRARELHERAFEHTHQTLERARAAARVSWLHYSLMEPDQAQSWLASAFEQLGEPGPTSTLRSVAKCGWQWLLGLQRREGQEPSDYAREKSRILCNLYYQQARISNHNDTNPLPLLQSILLGLRSAEQLGPSQELARAYACYAFVWAATGNRTRTDDVLRRSSQIAKQLRDPVAQATCDQLAMVMVSWAGDLDAAQRLSERLVRRDGHWLELAELNSLAHTFMDICGLQGRDSVGWDMASWVANKLSGLGVEVCVPAGTIIHLRAQACIAGEFDELDRRLASVHLTLVEPPRSSPSYYFWSSAKLRLLTSNANTKKDQYDAVFREFEAAGLNPASVSLITALFYAHRVEALLRPESFRRLRLSELTKAARDLKRAARIPLLLAHSLAADAYVAFFAGKYKQAEELFEKAEALGKKERAPAIDYAVYRGRAHLVRKTGTKVESNAWARRALMVAEANGSVYRQRWIKEEFDLD